MPDFTSVFTQERDHWRARAEAAEAEVDRLREKVAERTHEASLVATVRSDEMQALRARVGELTAEVERLRQERIDFTAALGFGDDINEPAAELAQLVDPIRDAMTEAREHDECPRLCELCGERLAETRCPECHGSGCGPGTASGAYDECALCAGGGFLHEGCAEVSYADLAAEVERLLPRRIVTVAELMAVPPETIVKTEGGSVACRFYDGIHGVVFGDDRPFKWECLSTELPGIVLWTPEAH